MRQNPIRYMKQHDPLRKWKIGGAFAAAVAGLWGAGYMLAEAGREEKPPAPQIAEPAKLTARPAQVWGVASEIGADGKQKATNNMWGLLQRATNEADNAQNKADREYSAKLDKRNCIYFWISRMNYNAFLDESDPIKKRKYLKEVGPSHFYYFTGQVDDPLKKPSPTYSDVLASLAAAAAPAMKARIKNNPQDYIGNEDTYILLWEQASDRQLSSHYLSMVHQFHDEKLAQAYSMFQKPDGPDPASAEGRSYYLAAQLMMPYRWDVWREKAPFPPGANEAQVKSAAQRAVAYIDKWFKLEDQRAQKFREEHNAPCP